MRKHRILWYYILTFVCTVILGGTAGALCDISVPNQYAISMAMVQISPLLGLSLLCLIGKDWSSFKKMQWNVFKNKKTILWILLSVLIPAIIITVSAFILSALGKEYVPNGYDSSTIIVIAIASLIGCVGEEIGWRGFMLPTYNKKYSLFISSLFTGMLWGAWHFGKISMHGIVGYLLFVLMITEFSVIMTWIYLKTNGNLVTMILFHLSINMASVFLLTEREGILFYIIGCIVSTVICVGVILSTKEGFFRKPDSND